MSPRRDLVGSQAWEIIGLILSDRPEQFLLEGLDASIGDARDRCIRSSFGFSRYCDGVVVFDYKAFVFKGQRVGFLAQYWPAWRLAIISLTVGDPVIHLAGDDGGRGKRGLVPLRAEPESLLVLGDANRADNRLAKSRSACPRQR